MPASRLSVEGVVINRYDAVGSDVRGVRCFVRHIALAARDSQIVTSGQRIVVNHMGPPLEREAEMAVDAHGTAALNVDETNQIELFIDEHHNEQQAQALRRFDSYIAHPHAGFGPDRAYRRFSCAGYVIEAYREAGINLVDTNDAQTPKIDLHTLYTVYPVLRRSEQDSTSRQRLGAPSREGLGLEGIGPWPVLLPGYILHSLARDVDAIRSEPYKAANGDESFPRK